MVEPREITQQGTREIFELANELAFKTASDVIVILIDDEGDSRGYATPKLRPMFSEGRPLIVKLMYDYNKETVAKMQAGVQHTGSARAGQPQSSEPFPEHPYIYNDEERHVALTSLFLKLREKFLSYTKPVNTNGYHGFLLVATLAHQMLHISSPSLAPLIETQSGMKVLSTLLNAPEESGPARTGDREQGDLIDRMSEVVSNFSFDASGIEEVPDDE
eukprot:TRINITY_DN8349_c0_g1_i1.p1 TRINITY_DN8349_c0_g1~~TRINITY_DN8349_c0_g1_i1.p1  ORF type:complete len:218 (-),score=53.40 TRINITY_DN8349_c0_g1_i1:302-955(-)